MCLSVSLSFSLNVKYWQTLCSSFSHSLSLTQTVCECFAQHSVTGLIWNCAKHRQSSLLMVFYPIKPVHPFADCKHTKNAQSFQKILFSCIGYSMRRTCASRLSKNYNQTDDSQAFDCGNKNRSLLKYSWSVLNKLNKRHVFGANSMPLVPLMFW